MEKVDALWRWLDGRKTIIASILLIAAAFLEQVVQGQWGVQSQLLARVTSTLDWFGMVIGGIGITHKGMKLAEAKAAPQDAGNGQGS